MIMCEAANVLACFFGMRLSILKGRGCRFLMLCFLQDRRALVANSSDQAGEGGEEGSRKQQRRRLMDMGPIRQRFAKSIRQLAEVTADHLSRQAPVLMPPSIKILPLPWV